MTKPVECSSGKTTPPEFGCSCCGAPQKQPVSNSRNFHWIDGSVKTQSGEIPKVKTSLNFRDRVGTIKTRWGIGRMRYLVPPGLYAVGGPAPESPVFVSANYKLSFDLLRKQLANRNGWILVLDTKGINVWCAAGKGTFGTGELLRRIKLTHLDNIVSHRRLIVPQLGATGVSAFKVQKASGFRVIFGPVRVKDLPAFLDSDMKVVPEMRLVRFDLKDRLVLVPIELMIGLKYMLLGSFLIALLGGFSSNGYSFTNVLSTGLTGASVFFGSFLSGTILGPLLLPVLPGRAFSIKGAVLGIFFVLVLFLSASHINLVSGSLLQMISFAIIIPTLLSFILMNFTGSTTFTSLSGVLREMRRAVPIQLTAAVIGFILWFGGLFINIGR